MRPNKPLASLPFLLYLTATSTSAASHHGRASIDDCTSTHVLETLTATLTLPAIVYSLSVPSLDTPEQDQKKEEEDESESQKEEEIQAGSLKSSSRPVETTLVTSTLNSKDSQAHALSWSETFKSSTITTHPKQLPSSSTASSITDFSATDPSQDVSAATDTSSILSDSTKTAASFSQASRPATLDEKGAAARHSPLDTRLLWAALITNFVCLV